MSSSMAKVFDRISDELQRYLTAQKMFFVATAPRHDDGHINLSPKGLDGTFSVLDDATIAYLDLTGSGVETIAHLKENGRICIMFCAFEGRPRIIRIHGTGDVVFPEDTEFAALRDHFDDYAGARAIIRIRAKRISDSCGYGVPLYEHKGSREQLTRWAESKGTEGIAAYQRANNAESLDGLPGV